MFKKNKKNTHENIPIPYWGPHDNLVPTDYYPDKTFSHYTETFEKRCKKFLKSIAKVVDRYNAGYMDQSIDRVLDEALSSLDIQQIEHLTTIDELYLVWKADLEFAHHRMVEIDNAILEVDAKLKKYESIFYKGTSYE